MKDYQTVSFWRDLFATIQDGTTTAAIADPLTGEVIVSAGEAVDGDVMARLEALRRYWQHARRVNGSGRQVCCFTCHECGGWLKTVLDGELWCGKCEAYR